MEELQHASLVHKPVVASWASRNESFAGLDRDGRIRAALRLVRGPLPRVELAWLRNYYSFLNARLPLPLEATHVGESSLGEELFNRVTVVALVDPETCPDPEHTGLLCRVYQGEHASEVLLVDIELSEEQPGFQLLEDYWYWFWNWRFDPCI